MPATSYRKPVLTSLDVPCEWGYQSSRITSVRAQYMLFRSLPHSFYMGASRPVISMGVWCGRYIGWDQLHAGGIRGAWFTHPQRTFRGVCTDILKLTVAIGGGLGGTVIIFVEAYFGRLTGANPI